MYNLSKPQKLIYDMEKYAGGAVAVVCGSMIVKGTKSLPELKRAVNELYRLNDAFRMRIIEIEHGVQQEVEEFTPCDVNVLHFHSRAELDLYGENWAKEPIDLYGPLCEIKPVLLAGSYGLLVKLHHIIADAWTISLIGTQFNTILSGETPAAYSYIEYLDKENAYMQSNRSAKDRAFFLEQFKECDEVTYLSEKQNTSLHSDRKTFVIRGKLANDVITYTKEHVASPFVLFMTVLATYMSRTRMNVEKFYMGTAVLNRAGIQEKNTAGMFINTVPVLMRLDNSASFAENLSSVKKAAFAVFRHQKYNYGNVLTDIRKEYGFSEKLYDVMFSYQNATITGADGGIESTWYHSGSQTESLQIHVDDRDREGIFRIHYDYQVEKFTETEIERIHRRIVSLLSDAIENDGKELRQLEILPEAEREVLLHDFNDTAVEYPRYKCIHTLFEEQAERTPDKTAVIACDKTLTYRELNEQANRIAHSLLKMGVGAGDIIAFALPRRSYLIAAMFGILKAGAAYMPIDPDYPKDRIDYMLQDSQAKLLITEKNILGLMENNCVDNLDVSVNVGDSFCALHTSGSTGMPKMSLLKHIGMINFIFANQDFWKNADIVVSTTIITFDAFTMESVLSIAQGYKIVLASEKDIYNQSNFEALFTHSTHNMLFSTPTKIENYTDFSTDKVFIARISSLVIGGEVFNSTLLTQIKDCSPKCGVFNIYGPTETTICASVDRIDIGAEITIGKPIANTQMYIVDHNIQLMPIGVIGELCIAGDGVGAGYLNHPELTAEKFIDNPFGEGKLYKTGDLAYWREDGNIIFVGRNDFQVKVRGLRIELGEIESTISSVNGVSQAVVVVRKDDTGRQLICAFYTENAPVPVEQIKSAIREKLPRYMMPHIFTCLPQMPLTPSGKINRKGLPEIDLSAAVSNTEYVAPQTPTEEKLAAIWGELLNIERVSRTDDFFDLGGDSLLSISLLTKLENSFEATVSIKDIFEHPILEQFAAFIDHAQNNLEQIVASGTRRYTLLPQQLAIYAVCNKNPQTLAYNMPVRIKWNESIDKNRLKNCIRRLFELHPELNTSIHVDGGVVYVAFDTDTEIIFEEYSEQDAQNFVRPFDLGKAPLLRVGFTETAMLFDVHHIIVDGESVNIILRDLAVLYEGGEPEKSEFSYADYAAYFHAADFEEHKAYFKNMLKCDFEPLALPEKKDPGTTEGASLFYQINKNVFEKGRKIARAKKMTDTMVFLGAFGILLSKYTARTDILSSVVLTNRIHKEVQGATGMFVNTLPVMLPVEGATADYLACVRDLMLNLYQYQEIPFFAVAEAVGMRDKNAVNTSFVYQADGVKRLAIGEAELIPAWIDTHAAKFDLTFELTPNENGCALRIEYNSGKYERKLMDRLFNGYLNIINQLDKKDLKDISVLSDVEHQKVIYDFNDTAVEYPRDKCVHTLFEEQTERTPDKTAVIACDKTLTYQELNKQANRIAHSLIEMGIGIGDIVAFALPRQSYLIAAMFGILKTGAAYMPVDPSYPKDRVDHMIRDSRAKLLITEESILDLLKNNHTDNPAIALSSESACYCIYTSGTTGEPKGILIAHCNVANFVQSNDVSTFQKSILNNCDYFIAANSVSFDITLQEIHLPLLNGRSVILLSDEQTYSIGKSAHLLRRKRCGLIITPTKLGIYMADQSFCESLQNVTLIMCGAETFPQQLRQQIQKYTNATIFNGYGPTETTCGVLYSKTEDGADITIGKPIANTQVYILDKYRQSVPIGVAGELCVSGDGVGKGYLNRPELTAEKFVPNPFLPGKTMYCTGDLARWRADGEIEYLGRMDTQVKIRGLRIELGEIESVMSGFNGIGLTAVADKQDETGHQYLVGYYTADSAIDEKALRQHLSAKLPKYMVPNYFVRLTEMPVTPSGKTDRKNLPVPEFTLQAREYIAPRTEQEKILCNVLSKLFNIESVGISDDFFELGGDSLRAIEYTAKAHHAGVSFPLQNVFDYPTVELLCKYLQARPAKEAVFTVEQFQKYEPILQKNVWDADADFVPCRCEMESVLLTGGTGFLGAHILDALIKHGVRKIYCLVRGSEEKLSQRLEYYFGQQYVKNTWSCIIPIIGDLENESVLNSLPERVDYVVHAAASVKHYGSWQYFKSANVDGTRRIIAYAQKVGARLIHISTISVSGNAGADQIELYVSEDEKHFYESSLYIDQPLDNVYIRSKFEAEMLVLDAMLEGLRANIIRVGNLTNRKSDLKFQPNYMENAFLTRVKAVLGLGCIPDYLLPLYAEFSPVDSTAEAIVTIAEHMNDRYTVFHANSDRNLYFDIMLEYLERLGHPMEVVSGGQFVKRIQETLAAQQSYAYEALSNDLDEKNHLQYDTHIHIENSFTVQYLKKLGFGWPEIDYAYIKDYLRYFTMLGYFGGSDIDR